MISFTIHHKDLSFKLEDKYHSSLIKLLERADRLTNGFITVKLTLPKKHGTDEQNRAFHALINEFFLSGCSSFDSVFEMKNYYKLQASEPLYYIWFDINGELHYAEKVSQISKGALKVVKIPKSWANFNREERKTAIELVISEGYNAGVNSKKWDEIIKGMQDENNKL